ncbi:MAG: GerAB/ArcD/ProY family transporter [Alphaproteobacteria bacterium]|nr:GerAB/ArcD/ProY family transporter [Alphaproteobacteria bacterium]
MGKISSFEYNTLLWFVMRAGYIGLSLSNVLNITKQDSYIGGFIALVLGLIPFLIFLYLRNYDKEKNIAEINESVFKKYGKIINIILIIGAIIFVQIVFIDLVYFINSQFLFKTKYIFIAFCFIIPIIYAIYKGINAISKTSLLMFYFVIFIIICIIIGVTRGINIHNLEPLFQSNFNSLIHVSFIIIAYNILPIFFLLIIPQKSIKNYSSKKSFLFYLLTLLSLINASFLTISIFGVNLSLLYEYPEFHVLKKVEMGDFIDRVETIFSLEWIIALLILVIICIYFIKEMIKTTFKTKEKTSLIIIIIACLFMIITGPYLFTTNAKAHIFLKGPMLYIMFTFFFIIPLIIMLRCLLKKHFHY